MVGKSPATSVVAAPGGIPSATARRRPDAHLDLVPPPIGMAPPASSGADGRRATFHPRGVRADGRRGSAPPSRVRVDAATVRPDGPRVRGDAPPVTPDESFVSPDAPFVRADASSVRPNGPSVRADEPRVRTDGWPVRLQKRQILPLLEVFSPHQQVLRRFGTLSPCPFCNLNLQPPN